MAKQPIPPNRKDGRFSGYVFLGYRPDGTEKRKYAYGKTEKEKDAKILDLRIKHATAQLVDQEMKLETWAEMWIKNKNQKEARTRQMYREVLDRHIIPAMGSMYMSKIKQFHVQDLINDLADRPRTANIALMTLHQIFDQAIENELMVKNPAIRKKLEVPTDKPAKKRRLSNIEETALQAATLTDKERLYVYLCRYAGLRKSEARGLMRTDVHGGKITVQRSAVDVPKTKTARAHSVIKDCPKSEAGFRTIPMQEPLLSFVRKYKSKGMYLIGNNKGGIMTANQYSHFWDRLCYKLNLSAGGSGEITKSRLYKIKVHAIGKDFSAHLLRHAYSTQLAEAGYSPAEIQYLMGHASATLSQEIYTHIEQSKITTDRLEAAKTDTALTPSAPSDTALTASK
jgi:integrase